MGLTDTEVSQVDLIRGILPINEQVKHSLDPKSKNRHESSPVRRTGKVRYLEHGALCVLMTPDCDSNNTTTEERDLP